MLQVAVDSAQFNCWHSSSHEAVSDGRTWNSEVKELAVKATLTMIFMIGNILTSPFAFQLIAG